MLWAHSQGWRPRPRHLFLASAAVVAVMVSLTPVGSSDTASYAAYGRIAAQGGNPYVSSPKAWLPYHDGGQYLRLVGEAWTKVSSVYGPFATAVGATLVASDLRTPLERSSIFGRAVLSEASASFSGAATRSQRSATPGLLRCGLVSGDTEVGKSM